MNHPWHIAILVPARDEEVLLPRCLRSIFAAQRALPASVTSDVIVVADQCSDRTFDLASSMLVGRGLALSIEAGCVGAARSRAASAALDRHAGPRHRTWLANTDADCEVPKTWLVDQWRLATKGLAAVAGIVNVIDFSEHLPVVEERFRLSYRIDAAGTHPHVHGANLGIRADAYLHAGGWNFLETAEDHDLWARVRASEFARVSDASLQVLTSGRKVGRAPLGFAGALAAHNEPQTA